MKNIYLLLLFASMYGYAQVQNPYLQTPTSNSIWVTWQTDLGTESIVEYGSSSTNLNQTVTGTHDAINSNWIWHKVQLTGLAPNTAYYYRVKTGSQIGPIKRFKTQPIEGTNTGHYRFIVMGDHQRGDNRYGLLVNAAKAKAEAKYGLPLEDHINLIVHTGDQVSEGNILSHWKNVQFGQGAPMTGNLPSITVVGNHDDGGSFGSFPNDGGNIGYYSRLFTYGDDANFHYGNNQGTRGDNYYAFQVANIAFVCVNSNQSWSDQTNWTQQIISSLDQDSSIEWVITDQHHPLYAEQLPGDASSYMKNTLLPIYKNTNKFAMYLSGHAHLYARGALRNEPVYHVINGGASWDQYWTQDIDTDYEDVQKTIIRQLYQIVDIDLDSREMFVETYSIGSSHGNFNEDVLIDSYYLKLDEIAPNTPGISVPSNISLPFEFEGSTYSGTEPYNSTEFQFAGPDGDFSNPIHRVKRDFENIFYDPTATNPTWEIVDLNAGVDIFKLNVTEDKLYQGENYVRVRYRDQSMHWSAWSNPVMFTTTNGQLTPPNPYPIAYFPFNGNIEDESVNGIDYDGGTNDGATFTNDATRGDVIDMDNNDMITIQSGNNAKNGLPTSQMTVSCWVKVDQADVWGGFLGLFQDNGSNESGWLLGTRNQRFSFALASDGNGQLEYLQDNEDFTLGQWYHVAATYNGSVAKIYVNGVEKVSSTTNSGNIEYPSSGWFQIGSYKDDNEDFRHDGSLDEITIWEKALNPQEILDVYNNGVDVGQTQDELILNYLFNGNTNDESSYQKDGTPVNINFINDPSKGNVAEFNNTSYIDVQTGTNGPNDLPTNALTVAAWVSVDEADAWGGFVSYFQDNGSFEKGWILGTRNQRFSIGMKSVGASSMTYMQDVTDFNLNQWYHVAATYDGTTVKLFVNGDEKVTSTAQSGAIDYPTQGWFTVGRYKDDNEDFRHDGKMDDVIVLSRALSQQEILDLVSASTPEFEVISDYKFSGNANDDSPYQKTGTTENVTFVNDTDRGENVVVMDNNGYIDIQTGNNAANDLPETTMTVSTWVKVENADTWGGFISCFQDNGTFERGWVLGTRNQRFSIALKSESTSSLTYLAAPSDFNLNQWYHVLATYDGSTIKLYVDGTEVASSTAQSGAIDYPNSGWYTIGRYKDDNEDFRHDGSLDNMLVLRRVVTNQEIQRLANNQTLLVNKDDQQLQRIKLYPNPVDSLLTVELPENKQQIQELKIINIKGQIISTESYTIDEKSKLIKVNVSKLTAGNYFIILKNSDGTMYQQQFIKK